MPGDEDVLRATELAGIAPTGAADGLVMPVREFVEEDWPLMRKLRIRAMSTDPSAFGSTLERERSLTEEQWRARIGRGRQYLAQDGDAEPSGLIGGVIHDGEAEVVSMWVVPELRGRRVADALLEAILARFAAEGFAYAVLWVTESNARAQRFYTRHGFTPTGDRQPVRDGEEPMEMKMRRELV